MIVELHGEYIILLIGYLFGIAVMALYVVAFVNSWFSLKGTVCMTIGVSNRRLKLRKTRITSCFSFRFMLK
jgi:hypothetical protein